MLVEDADSSPAEALIDAFWTEFAETSLGDMVQVSLQPDPSSPRDAVELSFIGTKVGSRHKGFASRTMALLTDLADRYDIVLRLGVAHDATGQHDGLTSEELVDWYTRWGFEGGQTMRRYPDEVR